MHIERPFAHNTPFCPSPFHHHTLWIVEFDKELGEALAMTILNSSPKAVCPDSMTPLGISSQLERMRLSFLDWYRFPVDLGLNRPTCGAYPLWHRRRGWHWVLVTIWLEWPLKEASDKALLCPKPSWRSLWPSNLVIFDLEMDDRAPPNDETVRARLCLKVGRIEWVLEREQATSNRLADSWLGKVAINSLLPEVLTCVFKVGTAAGAVAVGISSSS